MHLFPKKLDDSGIAIKPMADMEGSKSDEGHDPPSINSTTSSIQKNESPSTLKELMSKQWVLKPNSEDDAANELPLSSSSSQASESVPTIETNNDTPNEVLQSEPETEKDTEGEIPRPPSPPPIPKLTNFPHFMQLPPELRLLIWGFAMHPRIVTIEHKNPPNSNRSIKAYRPLTRSAIKESYPPLMATNQESRLNTLPLYTSLFPKPSLGAPKWHCNPMDHEALHSHAQHFIPDTFGFKTNPGYIMQMLNDYMNTHLEYAFVSSFKSFATHYRKPDGVIRPAFFNPEIDVLYLKREKWACGSKT
ncbi:hypothetical protein BDZ45DRAFT_676097 [Acephala macrosclerotiorum]|nr:hypothetical protein BDZ45DRAFT_676097 [Acephala macrosclerotiorum]